MGSLGKPGEGILLTGGTGHIGYRTLVEALQAGYKVRAAIRRESSIAEIKATKSIQPHLSSLSFVIVEDITKDSAFDRAVKDVSYIVHIASPLARPSDDLDKTIVQPAIYGTLKFPNYFVAYAISKTLAYNHTIEFIEIMPTFVIGKNELATTPKSVNGGSNSLALNVLLGVQNPAGMTGATVHVDDVAKLHIAALDPKIEGNRNFGANCNGINGIGWDSAIETARKHFPEAVKIGIFPLGGSQKSNPLPFDARETENVFGLKFKSFEEQIISLAGWYAEISSKV